MPNTIRFYHQGTIRTIESGAPTRTVLQHLREDLHCTGTKEGCAEGDCGACTVVVGELRDDRLELKTVNSCIQFMPTLDGKALFTVEDVKPDGAALHPVQQAMVECHGSQCGFCTPGFVMSLWGLYVNQEDGAASPRRREIDAALSGNLCRCTGYRPIIDAARRMFELPPVMFDRAAIADALRPLQRDRSLGYSHQGSRFAAPLSLDEALALRADRPQACLLAGSTDVGLWVTKQMRELKDIIYLGEVKELKSVASTGIHLEIGAGVPLEEAYRALSALYPAELPEMWQRFASLPVRNAGTLGGNVANGSPIGDSMPWLIALGAQVVLRSRSDERALALEDFYLGYQKKDLRPDELVAAIRVPLPESGLRFRTYKLAKRYDQDISAVCAAFSITIESDRIATCRIAYGGMAATPKRARATETALLGQPWNEPALEAATVMLEQDFSPLSDMRASAAYRMTAAKNLLRRFWLETRADAPLPSSALDVFALRAV
ncbi:MAG TPA: xanthine dehydrogenase small subunit [Noviherbaspirillum sp.]|jgi:xanthine dehydrogenase small subunit|uniref:xanthine dehydrogenase small subunit n=1 Tax=Noviherbaspirillum sp. TaxID=1926288 RepID=UPI002DDCF253|nr:xanthine dehydrogenase small subunit [Noviherbaspirillum sp.]HEV2611009.1 xanthine dehydrogenase small subunit [Noviherbaspirillum sp.]